MWSKLGEEQVAGRIRRQGQLEETHIFKILAADTSDMIMSEINASKYGLLTTFFVK